MCQGILVDMTLAGISTTVHSNQKSRSLKKPLENGQLFVAHFEISSCTDKLRSRTNLGASQKGPEPGLEPFVLADRAILVLQFLLTQLPTGASSNLQRKMFRFLVFSLEKTLRKFSKERLTLPGISSD